jgi:hypothetical protein
VAHGDDSVTGLRLTVALTRGEIAGVVTDQAGAPRPDVQVTAFGARLQRRGQRMARGIATATTDLDGRFTLALATGQAGDSRFALEARSPDGATAKVADVALGTRDVSMTLESPGSIAGHVRGFQGRVWITATALGGASRRRAGVATVDVSDDGDGAFELPNVPPGDYVIVARGGRQRVAVDVEVPPGQRVEIELTPGR